MENLSNRPDYLSFDSDTHEYKDGKGQKLLSVTTVLDNIPPDLRYKQVFIDKTNLGHRVHGHAERINRMRMQGKEHKVAYAYPEWSRDEPYVRAYLRFLKEKDPIITAVELKLMHPGFKYAGTLDLILCGAIIADIKCSHSVSPTVPLQLSAYLEAFNKQEKMSLKKRAVIHLKPNGTYTYAEFPYRTHKSDFDIFICKLKSKQWDLVNNPDSEF